MAQYEYDAWGRILNQSGEMADINPFRYRGYYYDTETGFYYLQTRYYDPQAMRFINADNYELIAELAQSYELNLYAYCANNPVMFTDETGEFSWLAVIVVSLFAIGGGTYYGVKAHKDGYRGWDVVSAVAKGVINGGLLGFAIVSIPTLFSSFGGYSAMTAASVTSSAVVISSGTIAKGVAVSAGLGYVFSSTSRPGDNRRQNKQFHDIMNELGIKDKKTQRRIHDALQGKNLGFRDLRQFVQEFLTKIGYKRG